MKTTSELAKHSLPFRHTVNRSISVYGLAVHTCGSSIIEQAIRLKVDPLQHVVDYYKKPDSFYPQYVIGYDGTIVQIADETDRAQHIGFAERAFYLDGSWRTKLPRELVELWQQRWPGFNSPNSLFPGTSPNNAYLGVEMLPLLPHMKSAYLMLKPTHLYTLAQHQAIVMLGHDIKQRNLLPSGWEMGPRLVGHEDVNPLTRSSKGKGWDPGWLRAEPVWFDFDYVRRLLKTA